MAGSSKYCLWLSEKPVMTTRVWMTFIRSARYVLLQLLKLPDGTIKVLVEGGEQAVVEAIDSGEDFSLATVRQLECDELADTEVDGTIRETVAHFEKYVNVSKKVPNEVLTSLSGIDDPMVADTIAAHMSVDLEEKQNILEMASVKSN